MYDLIFGAHFGLAQNISNSIFEAIAKNDCKQSKNLEAFHAFCFDNYLINEIEGKHRLYFEVVNKHTNELLASFTHKDCAYAFVEMRAAKVLNIDY